LLIQCTNLDSIFNFVSSSYAPLSFLDVKQNVLRDRCLNYK
jgi:hypothetical protein